MRTHLGWDVFFVLEEEELRRATDVKHYELAFQLRRTLVTLDRDYLDDGRFPPEQGSGVLIISAPDEREFAQLLKRLDHALFRLGAVSVPLLGRKLHAQTDWGREEHA